MKKILFVFLFVLLAFSVSAQTLIYYNSTPTLAWDAVTTDLDGNALLDEDVVTYSVYVYDTALGNIEEQTVGNLTFVGSTTEPELQLSFDYRSNWAAAVMVTIQDGDGNITYSDLAYTTEEPPVTETAPFVYAPNLSTVPSVTGLRDSGTQIVE